MMLTKINLKKLLRSWVFWFFFIIIICLIALIIFFQFYTIVKIDGQSMEPTLSNNQIKLAKRSNQITYNDIAIINFKSQLLIKRVIGLPGDNILIKNDELFLNGKFFLKLNNSSFNNLNITLSQNKFFALGDNLANSLDSRHFGPFLISEITAILI